MRYDPEEKTTKVLIDRLGGANGVKLSKNGKFVLVAETWKARILKLVCYLRILFTINRTI